MNDGIFAPKFELTPGISSMLDDIDRQRWLIDNMLLMPKHEAWLKRDADVRRAAGTTQIEGAALGEEEVRELTRAPGPAKPTDDERANLNALEAYQFIDFLSDQADLTVDELVIRQLNRYFISGSPATLTPGVYRKGMNRVGNFDPPDAGDVPALMRAFALWLRSDEQEIHPVIKAGIAHLHFVAIHPFWDGNGRTGRGLATLLLQRSPFGFRKLLSFESGLLAIRGEYFTAIERTLGLSFTDDYDATPWLEFFVVALRVHVAELVGQLTEWHRMMQQLHDLASEAGLSTRLVDGHMFAVQTGRITRSDYVEITGVSPVTASRDLAQLVERGMLKAEGKTRRRSYVPTRTWSSEAPSEDQLALPEQA